MEDRGTKFGSNRLLGARTHSAPDPPGAKHPEHESGRATLVLPSVILRRRCDDGRAFAAMRLLRSREQSRMEGLLLRISFAAHTMF